MTGRPWTEAEVNSAVHAYFTLLDAQEAGETVNKAAIYRKLASDNPRRSAKSFELKLQNISAILYEEKLPYADGLKPKANYQRLLKLLVLDYLDRVERPAQMPAEILVRKLRRLRRTSDLLPVTGSGSGRYGLTLEHHLSILPNSDKSADFMGIELKTKQDKSLQTLFSRVPSGYNSCSDKRDLLWSQGYHDEKRQRQALYTSFCSQPDSLGFSLAVRRNKIFVVRGGRDLLYYEAERLEEALLSKHSETAFVAVSTGRLESGAEGCRFEELVFCKWPSILRFLELARAGKIYLDFTLSDSAGKIRDHGFLWRIPSDSIADLYLHTEHIRLD